MRGLNKVTLIGNLGKDPELIRLETNVCVARFSLATTEVFKDANGQKTVSTEWHSIVAWKNLAELAANYLHKGSMVYVEGKLKTRQFEDKEGKTHYTTEIVANQVIMLDKKPLENAGD